MWWVSFSSSFRRLPALSHIPPRCRVVGWEGMGGGSQMLQLLCKDQLERNGKAKKIESGCLRHVLLFRILKMMSSSKLKYKHWQGPAAHKYTNRKQCLHQYCHEPQGTRSIGKAFICHVCECLIFNTQSTHDWHTSRKEIRHSCKRTHALDSPLCNLNLNWKKKTGVSNSWRHQFRRLTSSDRRLESETGTRGQ